MRSAAARYEDAKRLLRGRTDTLRYYNVYPSGTVTLKVLWFGFNEAPESELLKKLEKLADKVTESSYGGDKIYHFVGARKRKA